MRKSSIILSALLMASLWLMLCSFKSTSDEEMLSEGYTTEELDILKQDVVNGQTGQVFLPECHAQIDVPEGLVYLDKTQAKNLLIDYWDNHESVLEDLLGVLVPSENEYFYQIDVAYVISYDNCGYIRDNDAKSVDYDELLERMKEDFKDNNKSLPEANRCELIGWAVPPHYDSVNHALVWARTLAFQHGETVNYDIRILGKDGYVSVNAVVDPEFVDEVSITESSMVKSIHFDKGYAYADFDEKRDKISDWTIGGLVAGSILAKTGLLAKIGVLLLKFWKIIAVGVVAIAAGISKIFSSKKS
ncbi:MAG: DUF2167 domain-containing protein [Bacteroidales bacterium]|nr:DUF2167 domain-containing protein [Bacteroidales bacterium]